ncbi:hypothetical protein MRX96_028924 [Rhipicephalus microplus]
MAMRWAEVVGDEVITSTSWSNHCPVRNVRIDRQIRAVLVGVQTTEKFRAIADVLAKPIGDFQASRFFEFPAMLDTEAMAQIVETVRTSTGTERDEAAFLRCMLLGEIVASGDTLKLLTHAASVVAVDAYVARAERHISLYGDCAPNGIVAAVDLSFFAALMTRKATYREREEFNADGWDSLVAVVPVKMEYSGSRAVLPYVLSFLTSRYWTQRVAYLVKSHEVGTDGTNMRQIDCLHRAGQALIGGVQNTF